MTDCDLHHTHQDLRKKFAEAMAIFEDGCPDIRVQAYDSHSMIDGSQHAC